METSNPDSRFLDAVPVRQLRETAARGIRPAWEPAATAAPAARGSRWQPLLKALPWLFMPLALLALAGFVTRSSDAIAERGDIGVTGWMRLTALALMMSAVLGQWTALLRRTGPGRALTRLLASRTRAEAGAASQRHVLLDGVSLGALKRMAPAGIGKPDLSSLAVARGRRTTSAATWWGLVVAVPLLGAGVIGVLAFWMIRDLVQDGLGKSLLLQLPALAFAILGVRMVLTTGFRSLNNRRVRSRRRLLKRLLNWLMRLLGFRRGAPAGGGDAAAFAESTGSYLLRMGLISAAAIATFGIGIAPALSHGDDSGSGRVSGVAASQTTPTPTALLVLATPPGQPTAPTTSQPTAAATESPARGGSQPPSPTNTRQASVSGPSVTPSPLPPSPTPPTPSITPPAPSPTATKKPPTPTNTPKPPTPTNTPVTPTAVPDTDGDGVPDDVETAFGSNPKDPSSKPEHKTYDVLTSSKSCTDGIDNDGDGDIDGEDSGCS